MPVSWSNVDYFTRNIGTLISGPSATSTATVAELLEHMCSSNGPDAWTWPTAADVAEWTEAAGHPEVTGGDSSRPKALEMATAAAVNRVATLKGIPVLPVDADGAVDPAGEQVLIEARVYLATCLLAARLYDRRTSPDGPSNPWTGTDLDPEVVYLLDEPPSL